MLCWICGHPANTREHKFKRTDLVRSSATWAREDLPSFVSGDRWQQIQSPNSTIATFGKVLCGKCNSTRTQPFDRAYETFSEWINRANADLMAMPELDFTKIYGTNFCSSVLNLCKYFVKHLGCRLASDQYQIPPELASSLWANDLGSFEVSCSRSRVLGKLAARGPGILGNFPLLGTYSSSSGTVRGPYITGTIVGYLDVIIRYGFTQRYPWEGDPISHHQPSVRLGLYEGAKTGAHLFDGYLPDSCQSRRFRIGNVDFTLPLLAPDHIRHILSLKRPLEENTLEENIERRLHIIHAILSPFWPELTIQFLEQHLSISDTDTLWRLAFPPGS